MRKIQDDITTDHETLSELRRKRDSGRQLLAELNGELNRLSSELEDKTSLLNRLHRDCNLTDRGIKENQSRIFTIRDELAKLDEDAYCLQIDFETLEDGLIRLRREKQKKSSDIIKTEKGLVEASAGITALEKEKMDLAGRLEERLDEKGTLTDEISGALSETSLERDEVEARMQELNALFLARIQERNTAGERIAELERIEKALLEDIRNLEDERDLLDRAGVLKAERDTQKRVVEKLREEYDERLSSLNKIKKRLESGQDEFDSRTERNNALQRKIRSLEEEVTEYDEALKIQGKAREERDRTAEVIESDLEALRSLFTNRRELQAVLLLAEERIRALEGLAPETG